MVPLPPPPLVYLINTEEDKLVLSYLHLTTLCVFPTLPPLNTTTSTVVAATVHTFHHYHHYFSLSHMWHHSVAFVFVLFMSSSQLFLASDRPTDWLNWLSKHQHSHQNPCMLISYMDSCAIILPRLVLWKWSSLSHSNDLHTLVSFPSWCSQRGRVSHGHSLHSLTLGLCCWFFDE